MTTLHKLITNLPACLPHKYHTYMCQFCRIQEEGWFRSDAVVRCVDCDEIMQEVR